MREYKYEITDKHPVFKKGLILTKLSQSFKIENLDVSLYFNDNLINYELAKGYIKNVNKSVITFTKKGLLSFAKWCEDSLKEHIQVNTDDSFAIEENVNEWLKENP